MPEQKTPCLVRGKWLLADGKPDTRLFTIKPEHGGLNGGAWWSGAEILVQPTADGSWSASLLPSSVLGTYTVVRRGQQFKLIVPERAGVEFSAIATAQM